MTSLLATLRTASGRELRRRIVEGHRVAPEALEGWAYRGTSLGLPRVVERLTWKTFQKTFHRDPASGRLVGWNVRLHQDGLDAPSRPKERAGMPTTVWHYEVLEPDGVPMPRGFDRGLVIDYSRQPNPVWDTIRFAKDPLVAVEPGNSDLLLGVTYMNAGPLCLETPTYFLLEREHRLTHVPVEAGGPLALFDFERRWATALFSALLGGPVQPPASYWQALAQRTPMYFGPGLRAAVHGLTFLPLTLAGFRRPFYALTPAAQLACMARFGDDQRLAVRSLVATLKVLACFARFEEPGARALHRPLPAGARNAGALEHRAEAAP